ncbi:hypothetical protein [Winogradskyella aurantiaca]|uniref:hypothetical protein n=1 Tax=Winogradskyella aurantiaca TaxID=2219558 RepID=UPI000E1C4B21|nr:hypothetical protein [Winogradskyella aurantiaca]
MKLYLKGKGSLVYFAILLFISGLLCVSCKDAPVTPSNTETDLILKINAVQEQIMAQGNISQQEEQALLGLCSIVSHNDGLANHLNDEKLLFKDVDLVPVFKGCRNLSKEETKTCFINEVSSFINQEFNLELIKELNLPDPKEVDAFFIIDATGTLAGMKVRNTEVSIQGEILRVLRKMPRMAPAVNNGTNVSVLCSFKLYYKDAIDLEFVHIPEYPEE